MLARKPHDLWIMKSFPVSKTHTETHVVHANGDSNQLEAEVNTLEEGMAN